MFALFLSLNLSLYTHTHTLSPNSQSFSYAFADIFILQYALPVSNKILQPHKTTVPPGKTHNPVGSIRQSYLNISNAENIVSSFFFVKQESNSGSPIARDCLVFWESILFSAQPHHSWHERNTVGIRWLAQGHCTGQTLYVTYIGIYS